RSIRVIVSLPLARRLPDEHAAFLIRRIVVDRRDGYAQQAQVNGQLSAMMDGVIEHLSAQHQPAWLRENHMVARLEAPWCLKVLVARARDCGARGGNVVVEELQELGPRPGWLASERRIVGCLEVERIQIDGVLAPDPDQRAERREPA